ncbi:unnamed protein product [Protopolystoma xenopodis]|uniref:Uncharacterized protein n=1 Tax=Protopolystoma xenopodis TaxID=117903 RepID=A0A3S5CL63_9PLAT|nr:unnamed protein product [Protopolystoma xenopodis]
MLFSRGGINLRCLSPSLEVKPPWDTGQLVCATASGDHCCLHHHHHQLLHPQATRPCQKLSSLSAHEVVACPCRDGDDAVTALLVPSHTTWPHDLVTWNREEKALIHRRLCRGKCLFFLSPSISF